MKHLLNNLTEQEKNSIREQHTGGMRVSNNRFKALLENKLGNYKPLVEKFDDEDDTYFEDEELYSRAPERLVKHMDSGKIVGTHKHGVGYTPNKHGIRLGHSSHPTSIPNFTKFDDEDDYDFEGNVETHLESRTKRHYLINEQQKTPFNSAMQLDNVKKIQAQLGFTGADLDGKLGPKTFAAITAKLTSPGGKVDNTTVKPVVNPTSVTPVVNPTVTPDGTAKSVDGTVKPGEPGEQPVNQNIKTMTNKVASEGIKNVTPEMISSEQFSGTCSDSSFGGTFNGVNYVWDCNGVPGMSGVEDMVEGEIISEISKNMFAEIKKTPGDNNPESPCVGFYTKNDTGFVIYTTSDGKVKCLNF